MKAKELIQNILEVETNIEEADVIVDGNCIGIESLPKKEIRQYVWLYIDKLELDYRCSTLSIT